MHPRPAKHPSQCIFCEGKPLSREHMWGRWLRKHLPESAHNVTLHTGSLHGVNIGKQSRFDFVQRGRLHRPGAPHSQQLRVVCKPCNTLWMAKLQEQAKPYLLPHIAGQWPDIDEGGQAAIAAWATMLVMVLEFAHPPTIGTTRKQREDFRKCKIPPPDFFVWVGRYRGTRWVGAFNHFGLFGRLVALPETVPISGELSPLFRAQSTALTLGSLYIFCFSHQFDSCPINPVAFAEQNGLRCIWPSLGMAISAPSRNLDDIDADLLSRAFLSPPLRARARPVWETT